MSELPLKSSPEPQPADIRQVGKSLDDPTTGSWALAGLFMLALLTALKLAQDLILPVVLAFILSQVFAPVVRVIRKAGIPKPLGAALVVLTLFLSIFGGGYLLMEPAGAWMKKAPQGLREIGAKVRRITGSVDEVTKATEQVRSITDNMARGGAPKAKAATVTVATPSLLTRFITLSRGVALGVVSTLVLLYFLLASGDFFLHKIIAVTPRLADRKRAVNIARDIESEVSIYLLTVTMINFGLGCAVAAAMYGLDVPNAMLWGVMVGLFNFIPYIGDLASFGVLSIVGLLSFDELWRSLSVPAAFYVLTALEGYVVTPMILSRRLKLNPVVIVLSVLFWAWMWGILGALMAVPILVIAKTFCDHVESMKPFGEFLGE